MKVRSQAAAAALAVAGVSAQAGYPAESPLSYTTVTYNDCPTASIETMITVTEGVTATYCPKCHHDESSGVPTPTKHTTVYTTVYQSVCETGLAPVTHTITETCDGPEPTWTHGSDYVPPGFTTVVKECQACKGAMPTKPVLVTITEPCDCEATSGTSLEPTPTGPPGQYPPPGGDNGGDNGSTPPKPSGGDDSGNPPPGGNVPTGPGVTAPTAAPYPTPSTTVKCPGPECVATGSSGLPPPAGETGVTPPPYKGAASSYGHFGFAALSIVIGTLAFAL